MEPLVLGWREWVALPRLGLPALKAKIDTGAKTSALHAFSIETFGPAEAPRVRFGVHPVDYNSDVEVWCTAKVVDRRYVRSSNGQAEHRYIIETPIRIAGREWPIEVSLSNRHTMAHRMLLGRGALEAQSVNVRPWCEYLQDKLSFAIYADKALAAPQRRSLRIALLTMEPGNYSNRRLIEAAEARDHVIEPIDTLRCYMDIKSIASAVHYEGKALPNYDFVIPRIGVSITAYGTAVVRQFEMTGAQVLNSAQAIVQSRDKLFAHQLMAMHKLPTPDTAFASSHHDTEDLIKMVGGTPLVLKFLHGTQGKGVMLAENRKAAAALIEALRNAEESFLVQQFVAELAGQDLRCIVLDGKVIAAMVQALGHRRLPGQSAHRRHRLRDQDFARGTQARHPGRVQARLEIRGGGYFAVRERAAAARSQFLARTRRHREDHERRYCRAGAGLHRAPHFPRQAAPEKGRLSTAATARKLVKKSKMRLLETAAAASFPLLLHKAGSWLSGLQRELLPLADKAAILSGSWFIYSPGCFVLF